MSGNRYGKYFVKAPVMTRGGFFPVVIASGAKDFDGADFSLRVHYIAGPGVLIKEPHAHDFAQFYFFFGADLANIKEFGAEVELCLGDEGEKHVIDVPTAVHVPAGLVHGPMSFRNVSQPIIFIDTLLSAQYATR
ncbi:MAG: hypothetical protein A2Z29_05090 [Chloroflexi bacterium RBG_16_56_11]|nr:MAG: hypothetical protein A2Z29_05090 [Chloroflexi bacterium RBG_16_56_11]